MVWFGKFMSWAVGKCPNMFRSDVFSLIGKQKKIAHLITGHPVAVESNSNYLSLILSIFW